VKKSVVSILDKRISDIELSISKSEEEKNFVHEQLIALKKEYLESKENHKMTIEEAKEEADSILATAIDQSNALANKTAELLAEHKKQSENIMIESLKGEIVLTVLTILEQEMMENKTHKLPSIRDSVNSLKKIWN
jgi:F0F1-type ATP synthase membrane subunit b/b'